MNAVECSTFVVSIWQWACNWMREQHPNSMCAPICHYFNCIAWMSCTHIGVKETTRNIFQFLCRRLSAHSPCARLRFFVSVCFCNHNCFCLGVAVWCGADVCIVKMIPLLSIISRLCPKCAALIIYEFECEPFEGRSGDSAAPGRSTTDWSVCTVRTTLGCLHNVSHVWQLSTWCATWYRRTLSVDVCVRVAFVCDIVIQNMKWNEIQMTAESCAKPIMNIQCYTKHTITQCV